MNITVSAVWDPEAEVWLAQSEQVPGLVAEAATVEELSLKLERLIPELLMLNRVEPSPTTPSVQLVAERALHCVE